MTSEKRVEDNDLRKGLDSIGAIIVFSATSVLTVASMIGTVVSFAIYGVSDANSAIGTNQCLVLISCFISFIFTGLYLLSARRNEPVGKARPPASPLHSACFIIMRVGLLLWIVAAIVTTATTFGLRSCAISGELCLLQRIDTTVSVLACFAAAFLLCGLENCDEPFKTPSTLKIRPKVVCRISYFDNILERSVSRGSSVDLEKKPHYEESSNNVIAQENKIRRQPVPASQITHTNKPPQISKLLVGPSNPDRGGSAQEWIGPLKETGCEPAYQHRVSCNKIPSKPGPRTYQSSKSSKSSYIAWSASLSRSSSISNSTLASNSPPKRQHRRAAPSSSISSCSRRSPLSTMRTAENPDIVIKPKLHLFPPQTPLSSEQTAQWQLHSLRITPPQTARTRRRQRDQAGIIHRLALNKYCTEPVSLRHRYMSRDIQRPSTSSAISLVDRPKARSEMHEAYKYMGVGSYGDVLDAHTRLIEDSIQITASHRKLEEKDKSAAANSVNASRARRRAEPNVVSGQPEVENREREIIQLCRRSLSDKHPRTEKTNEESPVLPELNLGACSLYEERPDNVTHEVMMTLP